MRILPYCVGALQFSAGLVYLWNREWRLAALWIGVSVASVMTAGLK